jgi:hypothetical protein
MVHFRSEGVEFTLSTVAQVLALGYEANATAIGPLGDLARRREVVQCEF